MTGGQGQGQSRGRSRGQAAGPAGAVDGAGDAGQTAQAAETSQAAVVVRVDRGRCVGTGLCAATAPADLVLGADGRAEPRRPDGEAAAGGPELTEAAEMCPVEALTVHSARDGRQIAPVG